MWLKSRKPELYTGNPDSSQCPSHHQHTWVKKGPYHFVDFPGGSEVKNLLTNAEATETQVWSLGQEDLLENEVDTHSSILAWRIPWTWEPGRPPSMGPQKVGHDWVTVPAGWWVFFPAHHFIYFIKRLLSLVLESSYKWQKIKELEMENHPCHCGLSRIIVSTWDYLKGVPGKIWITASLNKRHRLQCPRTKLRAEHSHLKGLCYLGMQPQIVRASDFFKEDLEIGFSYEASQFSNTNF